MFQPRLYESTLLSIQKKLLIKIDYDNLIRNLASEKDRKIKFT